MKKRYLLSFTLSLCLLPSCTLLQSKKKAPVPVSFSLAPKAQTTVSISVFHQTLPVWQTHEHKLEFFIRHLNDPKPTLIEAQRKNHHYTFSIPESAFRKSNSPIQDIESFGFRVTTNAAPNMSAELTQDWQANEPWDEQVRRFAAAHTQLTSERITTPLTLLLEEGEIKSPPPEEPWNILIYHRREWPRGQARTVASLGAKDVRFSPSSSSTKIVYHFLSKDLRIRLPERLYLFPTAMNAAFEQEQPQDHWNILVLRDAMDDKKTSFPPLCGERLFPGGTPPVASIVLLKCN